MLNLNESRPMLYYHVYVYALPLCMQHPQRPALKMSFNATTLCASRNTGSAITLMIAGTTPTRRDAEG